MSALPQHLINVLPEGLPLAHNLSWDRVAFFVGSYILAILIWHFCIRSNLSSNCQIGLISTLATTATRDHDNNDNNNMTIGNKIYDVFSQLLVLTKVILSIVISIWTVSYMIQLVRISPHVTLTFTGWIYGFSAFSRFSQTCILFIYLIAKYCCSKSKSKSKSNSSNLNNQFSCLTRKSLNVTKLFVWIMHQTSLNMSIMVTIIYHAILRSAPMTLQGWKNYIYNDFHDFNVHGLNGLLAIIDFILWNPKIDISISIFASCISLLYVMLWWIIAPMYRLGMPYYFMSYWDGTDLFYYSSFMVLSLIISGVLKLAQICCQFGYSLCCQSHCVSVKSTKTE